MACAHYCLYKDGDTAGQADQPKSTAMHLEINEVTCHRLPSREFHENITQINKNI